MYGSNPGYVSSSRCRRPRCTEDFTLERLLGGMLGVLASLVRRWGFYSRYVTYSFLNIVVVDCLSIVEQSCSRSIEAPNCVFGLSRRRGGYVIT